MKEIKFVDVGEGITEGHLIKWLVKDGDNVKEDQSVAQVETDKAVVNVPAPVTGIIKEVAGENSILHVGDVVAAIGTAAELKSYAPGKPQTAQAQPQPVQPQIPAQAKAQQKPTAQPQPQPQAQPQKAAAKQPAAPQKQKEVIATPSVRKLAHDINVDIDMVTGTGPNGRILENDVRAATGAAPHAAPSRKFSEVVEQQHGEEIERISMSMTRKAIARNMTESWKIPTAVHMDLINATELFNIVSKEKPKVQKEKDVHLTFLPLIIKTVVEALKRNPRFNASYDGDTGEIILKKYYNIGLAAEAEDGLKVVVIKNADKKSVLQIAKEVQELHKKLLDKTITIDEMRDGTFTITNIGSLGGGFLSVPLINPPEVGILGVHSIRDWVFVENGKVKAGKVLPFSITFDHRVVDGADAVKFGNVLIECLEDPDFLELLG